MVQESRWQVQGRADRTPRGQTHTWSVFGNKAACKDIASDKTFPRKFKIWMVVELKHEDQRFHADIEVIGRRRGIWVPRFWKHRHDERGVDRKVFEPTEGIGNLNIIKFNQLIDTRIGAQNAYMSELDVESCLETRAVLSDMAKNPRQLLFLC